uniref:Uncharacterized protein n=1 Tax=Brassica campestris TaxID=3711 RepID=M4DEX1_BRACM
MEKVYEELDEVKADLQRCLREKDFVLKRLNEANDKLRTDGEEKNRGFEKERRKLVVALDEAGETSIDLEQKSNVYRAEIEGLKGTLAVAEKKKIEAERIMIQLIVREEREKRQSRYVGAAIREKLFLLAAEQTRNNMESNNEVYAMLKGLVRNIYFPFDIESNTAISVAREMVEELEMDDRDVTKIANMIDGEIASLVPDWRSGLGFESSLCNCTSNRSAIDFNVRQCCTNMCGEKHGRFEEITSGLHNFGKALYSHGKMTFSLSFVNMCRIIYSNADKPRNITVII